MTFVACSQATSDGIEFSGTFGAFGHNTGLMSVSAGKLYGLGTAVFTFFSLETIIGNIAAGATGLDGAAGSANISATGSGLALSSANLGAGLPVAGITIDDIRWRFDHNSAFPDTRTDALISMQNNATATVIAASSTDGTNSVLAAGVWVVDIASRMTATTAGRITFDPLANEKLPITASISVEPASGTNVNLSAYIAKNGVAIATSKRSTSASAGSPTSITLPWQLDFAQGDFVEVFVENNDNTTNILVSSAAQRIN